MLSILCGIQKEILMTISKLEKMRKEWEGQENVREGEFAKGMMDVCLK